MAKGDKEWEKRHAKNGEFFFNFARVFWWRRILKVSSCALRITVLVKLEQALTCHSNRCLPLVHSLFRIFPIMFAYCCSFLQIWLNFDLYIKMWKWRRNLEHKTGQIYTSAINKTHFQTYTLFAICFQLLWFFYVLFGVW